MPPRKLTPQTPGEPIQEPDIAEQIATEAEQAPADSTETVAEPQPTTTETTMPAADPAQVASRPGELPHAAEIDPMAIEQPVLTQQGYVVPEK